MTRDDRSPCDEIRPEGYRQRVRLPVDRDADHLLDRHYGLKSPDLVAQGIEAEVLDDLPPLRPSTAMLAEPDDEIREVVSVRQGSEPERLHRPAAVDRSTAGQDEERLAAVDMRDEKEIVAVNVVHCFVLMLRRRDDAPRR